MADTRLATVDDCRAAWSHCYALREALEQGVPLDVEQQGDILAIAMQALLDLANAREAQAAQAAVWVERSTTPVPDWLKLLQEEPTQ
jgi:hypothetical protein